MDLILDGSVQCLFIPIDIECDIEIQLISFNCGNLRNSCPRLMSY